MRPGFNCAGQGGRFFSQDTKFGRGSVVSLSFLFNNPPEEKQKTKNKKQKQTAVSTWRQLISSCPPIRSILRWEF